MKTANETVRPHLVALVRDLLGHADAETIRPADGVMKIAAGNYTDPDAYARECKQVMGRIPLMLAASCELAEPGQYKTLDVAGIPVLMVRDKDGSARAYLNSCTHRGAKLAEDCGTASRFTCPYHGWTFSQDGRLVGMPLRKEFGAVDLEEQSLVAFPVYEAAGLIWVTLDPNSTLEGKDFLQGYDDFLDIFDLQDWNVVSQRSLPGTNWKLAFEAHLEFYHLPVLHRETFGPDRSPKTLYYFWGPHQRLLQPVNNKSNAPEKSNLYANKDKSETDWPTEAMMLGEWIIFPNVSLNLFYDGGLGLLISQVIPGAGVDQSQTIQTFLSAGDRDAEQLKAALDLCDFLEHVVADEDLTTSAGQQQVLESGLLPNIVIGENEAGIQHFHSWMATIADTDDAALPALFSYKGQWAGL